MADENLGDMLEAAVVTAYGLAKLFALVAFLSALWYISTHIPQIVANSRVFGSFVEGLGKGFVEGLIPFINLGD